MMHNFHKRALSLELDLDVSPFANQAGPESVRVLFRRDGRELDMTPYLSDKELAAAYKQASELLGVRGKRGTSRA